MQSPLSFRGIVGRFGGHPARELDLDLDSEAGRAGWLLAAALGVEAPDEPGAAAYRALAAAGLGLPATLTSCDPARLARTLEAAGPSGQSSVRKRAERAAALLIRIARGLAERHEGSLERLAAEAGDLSELGSGLVRLAPGFGSASVLRFLRPLRSRWSAAGEVPLDPAALAAARHLGWIPEGADEEGEPAALAAALRVDPQAPPLQDVEAALARLGRAACRRGRPERCPLEAACPARAAATHAVTDE
jgi:hypothetical protein